MKLILVRHGETDFNRDGRIQGLGRQPLNSTGQTQAAAASQAVSAEAPFRLYSSPLVRAMQTAESISEATRVTVVPLEEVEELDTGEFEGLTGSQLRQRFPEIMARWDRDPGSTQMPGGESLRQVQDRVWKAVTDIARANPDRKVVIVTHNFPIQTIICRVLDAPLSNFRRLTIALGSITRMEFSGPNASIVSMNETWHLGLGKQTAQDAD
ncbi:histidine phosphatase family protein [Dehalococcoidia bacterium]|nr:histidine phosphatase family protein [Dehalococcoidia bacterium]